MTSPIGDVGLLRALDGFDRLTFVARGGSATVYRAWSSDLGGWVAVKVLDAAASERADREADVLARLVDHAHVVRLHRTGTTPDGRAYLVEEFVEGGSLEAQVASGSPLSPERVIAVGVALAGALGAAHEVGVVHGDVKPSNVLLDADGGVRLCDFGVSRSQGPALTGGATFTMTVLYAAPEVLEGARPSPRTDVYALGLTLHSLAAGAQPYSGLAERGLAPLVDGICQRSLAPLGDQVPAALREVLDVATAKDPDDRFASMRDFHAALMSAREGIGPNHSKRSRARRRRRIVWGAGVAVVAVVAGLVVWTTRDSGSSGGRVVDSATPAPAVAGTSVVGPGRVAAPTVLQWAEEDMKVPESFGARADGYLEVAVYEPEQTYRFCLPEPLVDKVPLAGDWCGVTYRGDGRGPAFPGRIDPSLSQMYVRVDLHDGTVALAVADTCGHRFVVDPDVCTRGAAPVVETDIAYSNRFRTEWKSCNEAGDPLQFPLDQIRGCLAAAGQWFPLGSVATPFLNVHQQADVAGGPLRVTFHRALPDGDPSLPRALSDAEIDVYPDGRMHVRRDCFPAMEIQWVDPGGNHRVFDGGVAPKDSSLPPPFAAAKDKECVSDTSW